MMFPPSVEINDTRRWLVDVHTEYVVGVVDGEGNVG